MATRTILQPNRAYDHIYDPVYTTSHANDHYRQTSKAMFNAQRIERVPDDKYLFSELPHYPRCTIQVTSKEALPRHVDKDWFSPVEKGADPNQDVVYGSHRFKFQAWPNKQMLSTLPHIVQYAFKSSHGSGFQAEGVAAAEPPTKRLECTTVGTQSIFRESEAQTDPYSPDYQIQPNQVPEVLQLTHLTYGPAIAQQCLQPWDLGVRRRGLGAGLPATEAELQIIERTRQKRLFKQMLPPPCDEFGMEVRVQLMEAQEFREWADRERTIKDLQDKRLKLLEQALLERDVKREDAQVSKVERVRQRKEEERDRKLAACQRLRTKVLRKMQKERTRADAPTTKRDVIAEYADFTSEVYAPLARHGHELQSEGDGVGKGDGTSPSASGGLKKFHVRNILDRPDSPRDKNDVLPEEEEQESAVLLLQRIIRGRAYQNLMFEGKEKRLDLINELRAAERFADTATTTEEKRYVDQLRDKAFEGVLESVQGGVLTNTVEQAAQSRALTEARLKAAKINQVVDMLEASAQDGPIFSALTYFEPEVVVRELVHSFNLPHVQREVLQRRVAQENQRFSEEQKCFQQELLYC
eukprot:s754_g8.t2